MWISRRLSSASQYVNFVKNVSYSMYVLLLKVTSGGTSVPGSAPVFATANIPAQSKYWRRFCGLPGILVLVSSKMKF